MGRPVVHFEVDDIATRLAKVESLGGETVIPKNAIPTGHFAWFTDPDGNMVGLLEPAR
jgi:hypothetical protein